MTERHAHNGQLYGEIPIFKKSSFLKIQKVHSDSSGMYTK